MPTENDHRREIVGLLTIPGDLHPRGKLPYNSKLGSYFVDLFVCLFNL